MNGQTLTEEQLANLDAAPLTEAKDKLQNLAANGTELKNLAPQLTLDKLKTGQEAAAQLTKLKDALTNAQAELAQALDVAQLAANEGIRRVLEGY